MVRKILGFFAHDVIHRPLRKSAENATPLYNSYATRHVNKPADRVKRATHVARPDFGSFKSSVVALEASFLF